MQLIKLLKCTNCYGNLTKKNQSLHCKKCDLHFPIIKNIPAFASANLLSTLLKKSQKEYDKIHQKPWDHLRDGSYEILASFARGNRTLDVACGDGYVEHLSPKTVGLDFSLAALIKAKKNGARFLVQATAEALPFKDNAFDLVICAGSLEHFGDPEKAISEMARVARIQILTVHSSIPGHNLATRILNIKHQPIEKPIGMRKLEQMLKRTGLQVVYKGVWTLPVNYGRVIPFLPELTSIPSSSFTICIKK